MAMRPRTSRPRSPQPSTTASTCSGRQPPCCSAPLTLIWTSTEAPGERRAVSAPRDRRSTDCQRCTWRSEEHTSELQSLMRISYAVFRLKKKKKDKLTLITTADLDTHK